MAEHKLTRDTDDHEFPSNSNKKKEMLEIKEKNITQVVSGKVIKKQRTFGQKLTETFFGDDTRSVGDYILHDILVPAMKSTLSDMVGGGIEMLLFGERRSSGKSQLFRDRDRSYVPYNRMSSRRDDIDDRRYISKAVRSRHDFDEIILETRGEAEDVLSHIVDIIDDYGVASVADYYDLLGVEGNFTDNKYGWTNVSDAYITRTRDGYSIRLPRPREI